MPAPAAASATCACVPPQADSPPRVWLHLTLTYGLLTAAVATLAGCSDWRRLSERAVQLSTRSTASPVEGLAAADSYAAEAQDAALELQMQEPPVTVPVHTRVAGDADQC